MQVDDGHGGLASQNVVITVNGTEDIPVITSGAQSGSVSEIADNAAGEDVTVHHQSGTVTFTDVDLSDIETGSVIARQVTNTNLHGYTLTAAQQTALLNAFTIAPATHSQADGTGTVGWHYDISDGALDFLGDLDDLTLTFTVQVDDGHGGLASQNVVITVTGTEDIPVITSGAQSGSVKEIADNAAGENVTVHHQSGTVTFTDVDLSDIETGSVTSRQVTATTLANGYTLTAAQQTALLNAFTIAPATHSQADGTGTVVWHYDISDGLLDFLGDNDQLTLTFTVQVNDGHGGTATQDVVLTVSGEISGTEDAPVITSGAQSGSVSEIADNAAGENVTVHHQSGTVTFTDVDLSDIETGSVIARQVTNTNLHGYTLTAAQQTALLNAFTIAPATHSQADGTGTVGWHYDISDGALDFLGDLDDLTLTFTVQVDDGHGGLASQNVVITVNGTEDIPVITSGAQSGSVSEIADNAAGENVTVHHQSGTVTFTDVDLSDIETGSVIARQVTNTNLHGYTLTAAQQTALLNAFTIAPATHSQADGTGTVGWHYDISDGALDFLGDLDDLTLTFTVQVDDGHGGLASQNVVITVTGTEDIPVITSGAQSGSVSEIADNAAGENVTVHHQSGTVAFTDVDLSDIETGSVIARQVTNTNLHGYTLTAAQQTALLNAFTIAPATHSQADGTGTVGWHYDISDGALDFLGDLDDLTLTFTVQVDDGHGGLASQNVVITVNGTEDIPVITSGAQSGSVSEIADNAAGENVTVHHQSGTVTFTDVDLSDIETGSVIARQVTNTNLHGYTLTAAQQTALLNAFTIAPATHSQADGTGTVGWHYDISDGALDFLGDLDDLTLTFTVQVDDGHGGLASQNVVITVTGTEDIPVITSGAQSGSVSEIADNAAGENVTVHHQSGTVTFTDVDLSDIETGSVIARQVTNTNLHGYTLTAAQQTALLNAFTIAPATHSQADGTGTVGWHYDISDGALDFLGDLDDLTLTFTVQVDDGHGGLASQNVVITVTGTEDIPVITSGAQSGSVSEIADNAAGENVTVHHQSGTVTFTDVDLSDIETGSVIARQVTNTNLHGYTLTAAQQTALLNAFTIAPATHSQADGTGTVGWHYDISDGALDFLGDLDDLTLTFTVQVDDGHGGLASQNVVITVNGTEDNPTISSAINSGTVTEDVLPTTASGTINFADVDLSDAHTVSVTGNSTAGYLGTLSASVTNDSTSDGIGQVTWNFNVNNADLQFLNGGQTLTQTYTVTINDGHSGTISKDIAITLVGADDADPNDFDNQATGSTVVTVGTVVHGTPGNDLIAGGGNSGNIIYGGAGNDTINGTGQGDTIYGGSGNDTLKGNGAEDVIFGGSGNDTIDGSNGSDIIIGGYGGDQLTGGNENDTFRFLDIKNSQPGAGSFDIIKDFTHNSDHLEFVGIPGATNIQEVVGSANTVDPHSISWFVDSANNQTIVYVNTTDTANHVDMEIHLTGTNINLSGSDILHHT